MFGLIAHMLQHPGLKRPASLGETPFLQAVLIVCLSAQRALQKAAIGRSVLAEHWWHPFLSSALQVQLGPAQRPAREAASTGQARQVAKLASCADQVSLANGKC